MIRALACGVVVAGLVVACSGKTTAESPNAGAQALGTYRDGCDEAACGTQPSPKHPCVGGYPVSVCTQARGTCGWQVDCVAEPPAGYDGNVGVGPCGDPTVGEQCGALPAYDDKDCVYGFVTKPQCERYGNAACAWSRRCGPQPCEQTGTCNTVDRSKLGGPCDAQTPCPEGYSCASISVNIGEYIPPTCVQGNSCPLTCAAPGASCHILESYPGQIVCGR